MEESSNKEKRSFFKTPWKVTALSVFVLAILGFVGFSIIHRSEYVWTNDAFVEAYGTDLSSNVVEKVVKLFVDEGEYVKKGQKIALLENNVPVAQKTEAQAKIVSMEQEIQVKKANYLKLKSDYKRAQKSLSDHIISTQDFEHVERDFQMSKAALKLSVANLKLAEKSLEVIEAKLTHYEIFAPHDGIIAKRWVWFGDVVQMGQSLFTMYDLEDIWVLANIEEKKIRKLKLKDRVEIHIDAYPGQKFYGEIFAIKGAAASKFTLVPQNNATGNYTKVEQRVPVKISIRRPNDFPSNKPLYLFPGMSAEIYVKVK